MEAEVGVMERQESRNAGGLWKLEKSRTLP